MKFENIYFYYDPSTYHYYDVEYNMATHDIVETIIADRRGTEKETKLRIFFSI